MSKHRWRWTDAGLADTDETPGISYADVIDVLEGDFAQRIESWAPGGEYLRVWGRTRSARLICITCVKLDRFSPVVHITAVRPFTDAETRAWEG